jgi:hypothetical protein
MSIASVRVGTADDRALLLANQTDVARRAVDLDPFPGRVGTGMGPGQQGQRSGFARSLAAADQPDLIAIPDTCLDRLG